MPKGDSHKLPKLYLRGFCEEDSGHVWVFKFGQSYNPGRHGERNNPFREGINDAAVERDIYAYRKPNGEIDHDTFEDGLQKIEHPADNALRKVREQETILKADKELLASYTQNMLKRVPSRRAGLSNIPEIVAGFPWRQMAFEYAAVGRFVLARKFFEAERYFKSTDGGHRLLQHNTMLIRYPRLHADLMSRSWTFFVAPKDTFFVTNEYPVNYQGAVGPPYMPFIFPISKEVALIGSHNLDDDLQYRQVSLDQALAINFLIIRGTYETVYAPKPDQRIWEILAQRLGLNESQSQFIKELATRRKE